MFHKSVVGRSLFRGHKGADVWVGKIGVGDGQGQMFAKDIAGGLGGLQVCIGIELQFHTDEGCDRDEGSDQGGKSLYTWGVFFEPAH